LADSTNLDFRDWIAGEDGDLNERAFAGRYLILRNYRISGATGRATHVIFSLTQALVGLLSAERNPRRPVCDTERFEALMAVANRVRVRVGWGKDARTEASALPTLLRLAWDTGRRIGAIVALRWSDWQPDRGTRGMLRWRAEEDKVGKEWWAPVTPEVRQELERLRRERLAVGDALMFAGPNKPAQPITIQLATDWLRQAEKVAKLEPLLGGAWHPFRRAWATARKHLSLKDVAAVGGWLDTTTLQRCYIHADLETMEAVVLQPRVVRRIQA
jgi:integrase